MSNDRQSQHKWYLALIFTETDDVITLNPNGVAKMPNMLHVAIKSLTTNNYKNIY
jgi:hypothetical protein